MSKVKEPLYLESTSSQSSAEKFNFFSTVLSNALGLDPQSDDPKAIKLNTDNKEIIIKKLRTELLKPERVNEFNSPSSKEFIRSFIARNKNASNDDFLADLFKSYSEVLNSQTQSEAFFHMFNSDTFEEVRKKNMARYRIYVETLSESLNPIAQAIKGLIPSQRIIDARVNEQIINAFTKLSNKEKQPIEKQTKGFGSENQMSHKSDNPVTQTLKNIQTKFHEIYKKIQTDPLFKRFTIESNFIYDLIDLKYCLDDIYPKYRRALESKEKQLKSQKAVSGQRRTVNNNDKLTIIRSLLNQLESKFKNVVNLSKKVITKIDEKHEFSQEEYEQYKADFELTPQFFEPCEYNENLSFDDVKRELLEGNKTPFREGVDKIRKELLH